MTDFSTKLGQQQLFAVEITNNKVNTINPISAETIEHLNDIIMAQYEMSLGKIKRKYKIRHGFNIRKNFAFCAKYSIVKAFDLLKRQFYCISA